MTDMPQGERCEPIWFQNFSPNIQNEIFSIMSDSAKHNEGQISREVFNVLLGRYNVNEPMFNELYSYMVYATNQEEKDIQRIRKPIRLPSQDLMTTQNMNEMDRDMRQTLGQSLNSVLDQEYYYPTYQHWEPVTGRFKNEWKEHHEVTHHNAHIHPVPLHTSDEIHIKSWRAIHKVAGGYSHIVRRGSYPYIYMHGMNGVQILSRAFILIPNFLLVQNVCSAITVYKIESNRKEQIYGLDSFFYKPGDMPINQANILDLKCGSSMLEIFSTVAPHFQNHGPNCAIRFRSVEPESMVISQVQWFFEIVLHMREFYNENCWLTIVNKQQSTNEIFFIIFVTSDVKTKKFTIRDKIPSRRRPNY